VSVYVSERARRQGVATALLQALVISSERENIWTFQAGIFPENTASLELHKKAGFRIVGVRERSGSMGGRWRERNHDGTAARPSECEAREYATLGPGRRGP